MPKAKTSLKALISIWLKDIPEKKYFRQERECIYCEACGKNYNFKKRSDLSQHVKSHSHQRAALRFDARPERQQLLTESPAIQRSEFHEEMAETFIAAGIPWSKLNNPKFKHFLEKYSKKNIPDESTLRKGYLKPVSMKAIESIREDIGDNAIWMAVDETIDPTGRYVANVIVGSLRKDKPGDAHLLMCRELEKTNNSTITQLVLDSFGMLWPGKEHAYIEQKFVLFLSDAVPYMVKSGKNLKRLYGKLLHVTCLAHAINLVAEEVRGQHEKTDKLIAALKMVFRKAPHRIQKLRAANPEIPQPPKPVLTRWGTWLEAVDYYSTHFRTIQSVVNSFKKSEAKSVENAQVLLNTPEVVTELTYICSNFSFLTATLKDFQRPGMRLSESLELLDSSQTKIDAASGAIARMVAQKFNSVLDKNPDLESLRQVSKILDGDPTASLQGTSLNGFDPQRIAILKYAPLTTVIAERSFSMSGALLTSRRRNMTMANFEMENVSHFELQSISLDD